MGIERQVLGVFHASGKSAKSGNDYDFAQVLVLSPIENVNKTGRVVAGVGYEQKSYDCSRDLVNRVAGMKFPGQYEFVTEADDSRGRLSLMVVDLKKV